MWRKSCSSKWMFVVPDLLSKMGQIWQHVDLHTWINFKYTCTRWFGLYYSRKSWHLQLSFRSLFFSLGVFFSLSLCNIPCQWHERPIYYFTRFVFSSSHFPIYLPRIVSYCKYNSVYFIHGKFTGYGEYAYIREECISFNKVAKSKRYHVYVS